MTTQKTNAQKGSAPINITSYIATFRLVFKIGLIKGKAAPAANAMSGAALFIQKQY